eukprot:6212768-Pleurochrysis_carterae.AAC.2
MCTPRALALCAFSFQSSRAHDRRRHVAPCAPDVTGDPPPAGAASFRACDRSQPHGSNSSRYRKEPNCKSTPGSGSVRGLKESILIIGSDRARPLSGCSVIQLVELPGLGKSGGPVYESIDR